MRNASERRIAVLRAHAATLRAAERNAATDYWRAHFAVEALRVERQAMTLEKR